MHSALKPTQSSAAMLAGSTHGAQGRENPPERERPVRIALEIRPNRGLLSLELASVWRYRELMYFLILRELKVRYKPEVHTNFSGAHCRQMGQRLHCLAKDVSEGNFWLQRSGKDLELLLTAAGRA